MKLTDVAIIAQAAVVAYYSAIEDHTARPLYAGMTDEEKASLELEIKTHIDDPELTAEAAHGLTRPPVPDAPAEGAEPPEAPPPFTEWESLHGEHRVRRALIKAIADASKPLLDPPPEEAPK